ncbi:MAG TPA: MDR family MFS transporter [Candidatus Solibacter sp.]|jgi:EmrB/QacA subfamily drug resistance transporter|nr:MDR family MFS transporter [Candidatus Solibacter sp.]
MAETLTKEQLSEQELAARHERLETGQAAEEALEEHHGLDRRMITFFGIMAAMFLAALDQSIVGTALPRVVGDLKGFDRYTWVTTIYLLTSTSVVPIVGKLSEQLGRKRVFLTGIVAFLLGSALCGLSQDMTQLILFRGFQGIGGGILTGTAFAVIADLFSPAERAKYTGMVAGTFGIASVVGPLVGGFLTDGQHIGGLLDITTNWRWIFYVNVPVGAAVMVALFVTFPSLRRIGSHPKIDYIGALGIGGGAAMLTLGASLAGTNDWSYAPVWYWLIAGTALLVATVFYEARQPEAVVPPQLFQNSIFSVSVLVTFITGVGMFGAIIYIPLFLQAVVGVKATNSGLLLLPLMAGMVVGSVGGGQILSRTGRYKVLVVIGMISMTLGMYLLTLLTVSATQFEVGRDVVFFGFGLGLSFAVFNVVAQNAVKAQYISSATSVLQFLRQIGGTLGLAVLGSIVNQQLKVKMGADVPAAALAKVPAALRSQITNPQALFSNAFDRVFAAIPGLRYGVKLALADSIHVAFVIGLAALIVGLALTFFIKEIPLRSTTAAQDRAAARAEALAS